MSREQEVFILADKQLNSIIAKIKPAQWDMPVPEWFQVGRTQTDMTLRKVINYHAYDEAWVPATLAGQTIEDATGVPASMDEDLLGADPATSYTALMDKAHAAVKTATNMDDNVHLTYGDWPAREYLKHITSFRAFRSYDLAKLIGADTAWPEELLAGVEELLAPHFDEWREWGVYQPAKPVPEGASRQAKLILASGRDL